MFSSKTPSIAARGTWKKEPVGDTVAPFWFPPAPLTYGMRSRARAAVLLLGAIAPRPGQGDGIDAVDARGRRSSRTSLGSCRVPETATVGPGRPRAPPALARQSPARAATPTPPRRPPSVRSQPPRHPRSPALRRMQSPGHPSPPSPQPPSLPDTSMRYASESPDHSCLRVGGRTPNRRACEFRISPNSSLNKVSHLGPVHRCGSKRKLSRKCATPFCLPR